MELTETKKDKIELSILSLFLLGKNTVKRLFLNF